jgi:succinate-semialdehyde dehydrogenase/glutarate-semialdehyde dehydrogenase
MSRHYINGNMVDGNGPELTIKNPATEETVGLFNGCGGSQVEEALQAAKAAFPGWSSLSLGERSEWMLKLADALLKEREHVLDLLIAETGKPLPNAEYDFGMLIDCLRYFSEEAKHVEGAIIPDLHNAFHNFIIRQPLGVVAGYLAWNFPLLNLGYKLGPALASGCTCVLKPSGLTPLASLYVGEIASEIGFPAGVFNIIAGDGRSIGAIMNASPIPRMLTLIGSTQAGSEIIRQSGDTIKRFSLELGGNAPAIVMEDADVEAAAKSIVDIKFSNAGQICVSPNRIFVHEKVVESFVHHAVSFASKVMLGAGREPEAQMGPLINNQARERMKELLKDAVRQGATIVLGGKEPVDKQKGYYFLPTVLTGVTEEMRVYQEEVFGPILAISTFTDKDEVVRRANNTSYGLAAYLFATNVNDILSISGSLESGTVCVNDPFYAVNLPHGGIKNSGVGKDCSAYSLEEYYYLKRISIKK